MKYFANRRLALRVSVEAILKLHILADLFVELKPSKPFLNLKLS